MFQYSSTPATATQQERKDYPRSNSRLAPLGCTSPPFTFTSILAGASCQLLYAMLCCAVLCCAVLCCAALCCAALCYVVPCCAKLSCAVLCRLTVSSSEGQQEVVEGDAVVFAVGVKAMQGIVSTSPPLAACPVGTYPPMLLPCRTHWPSAGLCSWLIPKL